MSIGFRFRGAGAGAGALVAATLATLAAQPAGEPLTNGGISRASARLDSVFIKRTLTQTFVRGGDWGSFLMARLGVVPIPPDLRLHVVVDPQRLVLAGTIGDLPHQTREALGMLLGMLPLATSIAGEIELARVGPEVVRFRLASARLGGMPVPEAMLQAVLQQVGRQYPALTETGRDLLVRVPADGDVALARGGVVLSRSADGAGRPRSPTRRPS